MISTDSIPESLRLNKNVTPFISRSIELEQANPVVSYYCKVFVIEHILDQKLHVDNSEVQAFTMELLDETEAVKKSGEESTLKEVLNNRQLSLNAVFIFAFKIFNSCLEDIKHYDGANKAKIGSKLKAALNFWSLLQLFYDQTDDVVDYSKTTGGKCVGAEQFILFCKDKQKTLKFQLSRLIKNEIPVQNDVEELERELDNLTFANTKTNNTSDGALGDFGEARETEEPEQDEENETGQVVNPEENENTEDLDVFHGESVHDPSKQVSSEHEFSLPGAPSFDPSHELKDDDATFELPGAPKFLPDDDLSHINKKSSIVVFSPESSETKATTNVKPNVTAVFPKLQSTKQTAVHVTKENLNSILDFSEQISKIQKHAKFAISALNYEDLETAEKELLQGLELLREVKKR